MSERRRVKKLMIHRRCGHAGGKRKVAPGVGPMAVAFSETKRMGEGRKRPNELFLVFPCLPQLI